MSNIVNTASCWILSEISRAAAFHFITYGYKELEKVGIKIDEIARANFSKFQSVLRISGSIFKGVAIICSFFFAPSFLLSTVQKNLSKDKAFPLSLNMKFIASTILISYGLAKKYSLDKTNFGSFLTTILKIVGLDLFLTDIENQLNTRYQDSKYAPLHYMMYAIVSYLLFYIKKTEESDSLIAIILHKKSETLREVVNRYLSVNEIFPLNPLEIYLSEEVRTKIEISLEDILVLDTPLTWDALTRDQETYLAFLTTVNFIATNALTENDIEWKRKLERLRLLTKITPDQMRQFSLDYLSDFRFLPRIPEDEGVET